MGWLRNIAILLSIGALGCGNSSSPQIVPIRGKATRNGRPIPHLLVDFQPTNGRNSWAYTDDQGRYELEYDEGVKGALVGEHTVTVSFRPKDLEAELALQSGALKLPADAERIAAKYGAGSPQRKKVNVAPGLDIVDLQLD